MIWPRWLARLLAKLGGYFWIPCPVCNEPFAGFEAGDGQVNHRDDGGGQASDLVCSKTRCQVVAAMRTEEFYETQRALERYAEKRRNQVELMKLCRHPYDGESPLDKDEQRRFIRLAIEAAWSEFSEVADVTGDTINLSVIAGRRKKEYDHYEERETEPPYYLWCRCSMWVAKEKLARPVPEALQRDASGYLRPSLIG